MVEIRLIFSQFFSFMSLFSLIICLIGLTLTEDGTVINNEDKRILNKKNLVNFVTFKVF